VVLQEWELAAVAMMMVVVVAVVTLQAHCRLT
jgi:hypothetical protein